MRALSGWGERRLHAALFWLVIAGLTFTGLGRGLWTPDEPREAEIGREMLVHVGFVPHLNGEPFFEKPPLYYWAMALAYRAAGVSEGSARAVSALSGLATLVLVFFWARRAASRETAFAAVFMLATCVQFFQSTHWVLLDPLLMFFVTLALWGAWSALAGEKRWWALSACYGGLCLAVWTKGLIGLVLPAAGLGCFFLLKRKERFLPRLRPFLGGAVTAAVIALCLGVFYLAEGGDALYQLVWVNHVRRFVSPTTTGHAQPFYYYAQALPIAVLPWLLPFLALFRPSFWKPAEEKTPPFRDYLGCVVAGGVVLLSLASTKRETYLLPLLPPLAILMAVALDRAVRKAMDGVTDLGDRWLFGRIQPFLLSFWGVAVPVALVIYTKSPRPPYLVLMTVALAVGLAGIALGAKGRFAPAWEMHRASALLLCAAVLVVAVPVVEAQKDMAPFARWVGFSVPGKGDIPALGADETLRGIIPFVTGRGIDVLSSTRWDELVTSGSTPEYLLEQTASGSGNRGVERAGYVALGERRFGPGRLIKLWRKAPRTELGHP